MVVLIIFPVILQTVINVIMLSTGGPGAQRVLRKQVSKRGTLLKSGYSSVVSLSSEKIVAGMHIHAVYHNKHWRRAF